MSRELSISRKGTRLRAQDEASCVERIRAGDEQAFETLFHTYYESLCRFVEGYVASADAAEEVVQSVFIRIWENRSTWFVRNGLRPYLFQAARNGALNHLKHERVKRGFAERVLRTSARPGAGQPAPGPEQRLDANLFAAAVAWAMAKLPHHYRDVVELRASQQMTHAEIARVLDLPVKTVETRARRGLEALRKLLSSVL
ncbi:MAG TPA: RNA polymerase sigma-70 factor [Longimicrobiales bacterium]|nr:RNA polymerase sigma-70 factor [Longimicrobiales bacterium]